MSEERYIESPEKARLNNDQLMLFPEFSKKFLSSFLELYQEGILSFDPTQNINQTHSLHAEISFFSSLLENNFTISQIKDICTNLEKPYQYDPHKLLYSFTKQKWYSYERRDLFSQQYMEEWIVQLQNDNNAVALRDMIQRAAHALFLLSGVEKDSEIHDSFDEE